MPRTPTYANVSGPMSHHGFVWWLTQRAGSTDRDETVRVTMCNPDGRPVCLTHDVPRASAGQLRDWIANGRVRTND